MKSHSSDWISDARRALMRSEVDFFRLSPARYWIDFLVSVTIAFTAGTIYLNSPVISWQELIAFPITAFWLYRCGSLIHEVAHLPQHEMRTSRSPGTCSSASRRSPLPRSIPAITETTTPSGCTAPRRIRSTSSTSAGGEAGRACSATCWKK